MTDRNARDSSSPQGPKGMKRRAVLKLGAAGAAAAGAASSGCAVLDALGRTDLTAQGASGPPLGEDAIRAWCKRLDTGMRVIETGRGLTHLLPGVDPEVPADRKEARRVDALSRKALRGLTFASMYTQLPEQNREHPLVHARAARYAPELDDAVMSMTAEMAAQTPEDHTALREELRKDPDLPLKLASVFDAPARELGVPPPSRAQMKHILGTVGWRLQKQSPDTVFAEYVGKVEKIAARCGQKEELQRRVATAALERQLFAGAAAPSPRTPPHVALRDPEVPKDDTPAPRKSPPPLQAERRRQKLALAHRELTAGGIILGVGLATFGAGAAAVWGAGLFAGAVAMTVGGIVLLIGLITVIVGAVRRSHYRKS